MSELVTELYEKVTDTDRYIIDGLAEGKMGKDIAIEMGVTRQAVSHRLKVIRRKYHSIKCKWERI
jgi:FixJ family two-component response regulator